MPKWTDYTTKTKPADNDELMILDTAGKANKRLGLSVLSDWILNKIADKVFQKLETNNKTVLGAINELNSKIKIYDIGSYYKTYTFTGFVKEKIKVGICVLSGYKGFLFSDLPEDLSATVNIIIYKGSTQNDGRYAQGLITDSIGKRYSFVVSQDYSTLSIKPF